MLTPIFTFQLCSGAGIHTNSSIYALREKPDWLSQDYLVSGNKHLLDVKEFQGIKIVTARQILEILAI